MLLNRKEAPNVEMSSAFNFLKADSEVLDNGVPFHFINYSEQEILRVQLVFEAGTIFQEQNLVASTVCNLITEGTKNRGSREIAELIENKGVFIETECTADNACISIYCLINQLERVLPILVEIIEEANFQDKEVQDYLNIASQKFNVNSQKVGFLARNEFSAFIFGKDHPYSNKIIHSDFEEIKRNQLISFFQSFYKKGKLEIYAAGRVNNVVKKLINNYLGSIDRSDVKMQLPSFFSNSDDRREMTIKKESALQTAIRIGKKTILKSHSDFPTLYMANVILGGFFGSRLMSNLREDKGYTYGIHSGIVNYKNSAYFVISTEVGSSVAIDAVNQIRIELDRITSTIVSDEELELVRNYIMGSLRRGFDGAFAAMDRFKSINTLDLDYDYYTNLVDQIGTVNSKQLKEIAERFLQFNTMKTILAGNL